MKKTLLFLLVMLLCITKSYSQASYNTGALTVEIDEYGGISLLNSGNTYELYRAAILVGTSPTAVFDYKNDAGVVDQTALVTNPTSSDFEIYGSVDNSYSGLPPAVLVKFNSFGWTNGAYTIIRFNVTNTETSAVDASIGLDILSYINETWGYDTIDYNTTHSVIRFHKGAVTNMGIKLLSASLSSLYSFEWYSGYEVDSDYWIWMHYGSLESFYASTTTDGPVTITSQNAVTLAPGQSCNVYYALALGYDEQNMLANITQAEVKYQALIVGVQDNKTVVNELKLGQNSPNPFTSSTTIAYQLPGDGFVSLKVYNALGNVVATLVNSNQTRGSHTIQYNANDLPGGVYFYTLRYNDQVKSNKMFLIK